MTNRTPNQPFARPARFAQAEWQARVQLAAAYRIFDHLGWSELIYNHISLRVPGEDTHFLINPFGLHYREVCASNLVKVDVDGHSVGHADWPFNPAGVTFHAAIHAALPDAHCVMHVHTTPTMAVCATRRGLSFSISMRRNCTAASRITISRASPCGPTKAGGSSTARPGGRCCCCAITGRSRSAARSRMRSR